MREWGQFSYLWSLAVLESFATVEMIDVFVPSTDGREISFTRYTKSEPEQSCRITRRVCALVAKFADRQAVAIAILRYPDMAWPEDT